LAGHDLTLTALLFCCSAAAAEFENMIQEQNLEMNSLSFRIKVLTHPQDKKKYVGFVNTVSCCKMLQSIQQ
jgi:hypothetical protein